MGLNNLNRKLKVATVILVTLLIIWWFISVYFHLQKPPRPKGEWIKVEVAAFVMPEIASIMKEDDIGVNKYIQSSARLLRFIKKEPQEVERLRQEVLEKWFFDTRDDWRTALLDLFRDSYKDKIPIFMEIELLCQKDPTTSWWLYPTDPILVNDGFDFITTKYTVRCYVLKICES